MNLDENKNNRKLKDYELKKEKYEIFKKNKVIDEYLKNVYEIEFQKDTSDLKLKNLNENQLKLVAQFLQTCDDFEYFLDHLDKNTLKSMFPFLTDFEIENGRVLTHQALCEYYYDYQKKALFINEETILKKEEMKKYKKICKDLNKKILKDKDFRIKIKIFNQLICDVLNDNSKTEDEIRLSINQTKLEKLEKQLLDKISNDDYSNEENDNTFDIIKKGVNFVKTLVNLKNGNVNELKNQKLNEDEKEKKQFIEKKLKEENSVEKLDNEHSSFKKLMGNENFSKIINIAYEISRLGLNFGRVVFNGVLVLLTRLPADIIDFIMFAFSIAELSVLSFYRGLKVHYYLFLLPQSSNFKILYENVDQFFIDHILLLEGEKMEELKASMNDVEKKEYSYLFNKQKYNELKKNRILNIGESFKNDVVYILVDFINVYGQLLGLIPFESGIIPNVILFLVTFTKSLIKVSLKLFVRIIFEIVYYSFKLVDKLKVSKYLFNTKEIKKNVNKVFEKIDEIIRDENGNVKPMFNFFKKITDYVQNVGMEKIYEIIEKFQSVFMGILLGQLIIYDKYYLKKKFKKYSKIQELYKDVEDKDPLIEELKERGKFFFEGIKKIIAVFNIDKHKEEKQKLKQVEELKEEEKSIKE